MADCAACGLPLDPAARYCRHCGVGVAEAGGLRGYGQAGIDLAGEPTPAPTGQPRRGGPAGGRAAGPPARHTRRGWRIVVIAVVMLAVAGSVAAALVTVRRLGQPATMPGTAAPIGAAPTSQPTTKPAARAPTTTPPPTPLPVDLADSLSDSPYAPKVVALFRKYFEAINGRDYQSWLETLTRDREPDTREEFMEKYSTTIDDQVKIVGITAREDGTLLVAVSFRSHQDPKYAPQDQRVDCLNWQIAYPLRFDPSVLKIALVEFVNRTYRPCAD